MTDFDRLSALGKDYRPLRPRSPAGGGPSPLNFSMPIDEATLQETRQATEERAMQALQGARARGAPGDELARLEQIAGAQSGPSNPIEAITGVLGLPADLLRFGVMDLLPGGANPTSEDYADIMTLNKRRMIERHLSTPQGEREWGRSGERRATDIIESWFPYSEEAPGPWDEIMGGIRFVTATGLDIASDPTSYVTFGGAGVARAAATQVSELLTRQAILSGKKLLGEFGDDALDIAVRSAAKEGTSPLVVNAAERLQVSARKLQATDGWKNRSVTDLVDEVAGLRTRDNLLNKLDPDIGDPGDLLFRPEDLHPLGDDAVAPILKDSMDNDTVWAEMSTEIGSTVAKKQFHNRDQLFQDYTEHVLNHMEQRNAAAIGSIGGMSFQVPFFTKTAKSLGWLQRATRGTVTQVTRGGRLQLFERIGMTGPVFKARQAMNSMMKKHGSRQAEVMALRDRSLLPEVRKASYLGVVQVRAMNDLVRETVAHLDTAAGLDQESRELVRLVWGISKAKDDEEAMMQTITRSYIRDGEEMTIDQFPKGATQGQVDLINRQVKKLRYLQNSAEKAYAALDPRFREMLATSERTYTPLRLAKDIDKTIINNRENFDNFIREYQAFKDLPDNKGMKTSQLIEAFAAKKSRDLQIELRADDIAVFWDFINGFTAVKRGADLLALGEVDVLRLRTLGSTARVIEKVDPKTGQYMMESIEEFQDLSDINTRLTALVNEYLPDQAKVKDVLLTNPGELVHHWIQSMHLAVSERLLMSMMVGAGALESAKTKLILTDMLLNRYARKGVLRDLSDVVQVMWDATDVLETGHITPTQWANILKNHAVKTIEVKVGDMTIPFPRQAFFDPQMQEAVAQLDEYLSTFVTNAQVHAKAARLLMGKAGERYTNAADIYDFVSRNLRTQYKVYRANTVKAHRHAINQRFGQLEEIMMTSGAEQESLVLLHAEKRKVLEGVEDELRKLDEAHAKNLDELNRKALADTLNGDMNEFMENLPKSPVHWKVTVANAGETMTEPAHVQELIDVVVDASRKHVDDIHAAAKRTSPQLASRLHVEANEYRRIVEGIEEVPTVMVTGGRPTDAGWNVPNRGEADAWIEYQPGFMGEGFDDEANLPISRILPEGAMDKDQRTVSVGLPKALGWKESSGDTVEDWWADNFILIDEMGVWMYTGDAPAPFFVLSTYQAKDSEILGQMLANLWHTQNVGTAVTAELKPLRIHGLTGTGMLPSGDSAAPSHVLEAITRLRNGDPSLRLQTATTARYVEALDLYEAEIDVLAEGIAAKQNLTLVKARDLAMRNLTFKKFMAEHGYAIRYRPGYQRSFMRAKSSKRLQGMAVPPKGSGRKPGVAARPVRQKKIRDEVAGLKEVIGVSEADIIERQLLVEVPNAHAYNLTLADQLGLEDVDDMDPESLYEQLIDLANAGEAIEPIAPYQLETSPMMAVLSVERLRQLGGRGYYDEDYLDFVAQEAAAISGGSPAVADLINSIDFDQAAVRQLEDLIEGAYGRPMDEIAEGITIGWEQVPTTIPPDLDLIIRKAYKEKFPSQATRRERYAARQQRLEGAADTEAFERKETFRMMLKLREVGWYPDADEIRYLDQSLDADQFIGESGQITDQLEAFIDEAEAPLDVEGTKAYINEKWDDLAEDYTDLVDTHRKMGSPSLKDSDNPFWRWLRDNYPGLNLAKLGAATESTVFEAGEVRPVVTAMSPAAQAEEAGRMLLAAERKLAGVEPDDPSFRSIFQQHGEQDPEAIWREFYTRSDNENVLPEYRKIIDVYEAGMEGTVSGHLLERDLVLALLEITYPDIESYGVLEVLAEKLAKMETDRRLLDEVDVPGFATQRHGADFAWAERDFEDMGANVTKRRPALEDEEEAKARAYEEERGEVEYEEGEVASYVNSDAKTFNVDEVKTMWGSGLKPHQELMGSAVEGTVYFDLEHIIIRQHHKRRFADFYQPPGGRPGKSITYGMQDPVEQTEGLLPGGAPTTDFEGQPSPFRQTQGGTGGPPGIDETMADEFGRPQSIELDPRERYPSEGFVDERTVIHQLEPGGGPPSTYLGEVEGEFSRNSVIRYQQHQKAIRDSLAETPFPARNVQRFVALEEMDSIIDDVDGVIEGLIRPNKKNTHLSNRQYLSYMGVDWMAGQEAWNAFKATGHPKFLLDPNLRKLIAVASSMEGTKAAKRIAASDAANFDIPAVQTAADRLAIRRELGVDPAPLGNDIEVVRRARAKGQRTQIIGASGSRYRLLRNESKKAQEEAANVTGLTVSTPGTSTGFGRDPSGVNVGRVTSQGERGPRSNIPFGNPFREGDSIDDLLARATVPQVQAHLQRIRATRPAALPSPEQAPVAATVDQLTLDESVDLYSTWLDAMVETNPRFADDVADLSGKRLLCPGKPHSPCHARPLAAKADELAAGTNRYAAMGISGVQDGADRIWLEEVRDFGAPTGGTAPPGWATASGADPTMEADFGVTQYDRANYDWDPANNNLWVPRTEANVYDSDGTIWFGDINSPGGKATRRAAQRFGKPILINPTPTKARLWMMENNIRIVNGAGNRDYADRNQIRAVVKAIFTKGEGRAAGVTPIPSGIGPVDVGRHNRPRDINLGNPFYVKEPGARSQFANRSHPWYRRRVVQPGRPAQAVERVTGVDANGKPIRQTVMEPAIPGESTWVAVPYTEVGSAAEADRMFYEMLWDMLDDPEFGPAARAELVDKLQGRLLFRYAGGGDKYVASKVQDGQMLADAVDWITDGKYDEAMAASRMAIHEGSRVTGRPRPTGSFPYHDPETQDVIARASEGIDMDAVTEVWAKYWSAMDALDEKEIELHRTKLIHLLDNQPELIASVLDPTSAQATMMTSHLGQHLQPILDETRALTERLGLSWSGWSDRLLQEAIVASQVNPVIAVLTEAARNVHGGEAVIKQVLGPESVYLRIDKPLAEQHAWATHLDAIDLNHLRGYDGPSPVPLSLTFKNLDEMGEVEAKRQGLEMSWQLSQSSKTLTQKRDRLASEVADLETSMKSGQATNAMKDEYTTKRVQLEEAESSIRLLHNIMDQAWEVSFTGNNKGFRMRLGSTGRLEPTSDKWKQYKAALDLLPLEHRLSVEFLVETARVADLFPSFDDFASYWFKEKNITVKKVEAVHKMLSQTYREAQVDPYKWDQILTLGAPEQYPLRQVLLDLAQLVRIHPELDETKLFAEMVSKIGISSHNVDTSKGVAILHEGDREDIVEVVESLIKGLQMLDRHSTLELMARSGGLGIDDAFKDKLASLIDNLKIRGEERVAFAEGVSGSYAGLAGIFEDSMVQPIVLMEMQRALHRMHLAADPRIGMEIMGGMSKILGWWTKAATVARPTFHLRNLVGGLWNNMIIGVSPHRAIRLMPDMLKFVRNRRTLGEIDDWDGDMSTVIEDVLLRGISEDNKELFTRAVRVGVMDAAFSSTLPKNLTRYHGMRAWAPWNGDNRYFMAGTQAMEFVEGILRMSAFERYYDSAFPHLSSQLAKVMVNMVHFDYSDLTNFDKVIKKFIPFWVWTSRNLPLQMRNMLENPRMLAIYQHAKENWNDQFGDPEDPNNEWLKEKGWILPFRRSDDMGNWIQMSWEPALPFTDLIELPLFKQTFADGGVRDIIGDHAFDPGQWIGWLTGNLAPQYSSLGELVTNPRESWDRQNAMPGLGAVMRALGQGETTPQGEQRISPVWNSLLATGIPFYNEYVTLAGIPTNTPYSAGNQGFLPNEYLEEKDNWVANAPWIAGQQLARGLGAHWRSPEDIYWQYKDWEAYTEAAWENERMMRSSAYAQAAPPGEYLLGPEP